MDIDAEYTIPREPAGAEGAVPAAGAPAGPSLSAGLGSGPPGGPSVGLSAASAAVPAADPTGDERVDTALARFEELGRTTVAEHVEIFDDVRHRLQDVLTSIDQDGPRPPAPPRS